MKKIALIMALLSISSNAYTASYTINNASISVYLQSDAVPGMIRTAGIYNGGDHPTCGNGVYFNAEDSNIASALITASMTDTKINFIYSDSAPAVDIIGHQRTNCKIVSIWF